MLGPTAAIKIQRSTAVLRRQGLDRPPARRRPQCPSSRHEPPQPRPSGDRPAARGRNQPSAPSTPTRDRADGDVGFGPFARLERNRGPRLEHTRTMHLTHSARAARNSLQEHELEPPSPSRVSSRAASKCQRARAEAVGRNGRKGLRIVAPHPTTLAPTRSRR